MAKPRVIIADTDINYIIPIQLKFAENFFDKIDLEIITDTEYFDDLFTTPQTADVLLVSDEMYSPSIQKHSIPNIFLMTEHYEEGDTGELNVNRIFKYTSIKEIFNEVVSQSAGALNTVEQEKKDTQVVLVTSAYGGAGKTTIAMGICASLVQSHKRVLYINASNLQMFQYMLENQAPISAPDVYAALLKPGEDLYQKIKHVIRFEKFNYIPPFRAALFAMGLNYSIFEKIAISAKRSKDYDFVIIDADNGFDDYLLNLINLVDTVVMVTEQGLKAVCCTNHFMENVNNVDAEKYIFICNMFDKNAPNALVLPESSLRFNINEFVEKLDASELKLDSLVDNIGIRKGAFLLV